VARTVTGVVAPEDFTAFVAAHEEDLRRACYGLTGDDHLVDGLEREMLGALARRWKRLRRDRSGTKAVRYVNQLLDRESPNWPRDDSAVGGGGDGPRVAPVDEELAPRVAPAILAESVWAEARRRPPGRSRVLVLVGLAVVGALLVPHPVPVPAPPPPPPDAPILVPEFVQILKPIQLMGNVTPSPLLPASLDPDPATARPWGAGTGAAVAALTQHGDAAIVAYGADGRRWRLDAPGLALAHLWLTSLAPDGRTAVVSVPGGAAIVDLVGGRVLPIGAAGSAAQPLWRDATSFLVAGKSGTVISFRTDGTSDGELTGFNPARLVTGRPGASGPGELVELTGAPPATAAQLRRLEVLPGGTTVTDRGSIPVIGAAWLGPWRAQGYGNGTVLLAAADPTNLLLPPNTGAASAGVFAVDERSGRVLHALIQGERGATLDVLGWLPGNVGLIQLSWDRGARLLSWNLDSGAVTTVSGVLSTATVSVRDLSQGAR
jgi:hypothetical protein